MTFLRHALGFILLILGAGIGYLSKWLIQVAAWLVDQEEHAKEVEKALNTAMHEIYYPKRKQK